MRTPALVFLLLSVAQAALGGQFNTHWIYAPQADSLSHVWFRRAFISGGRPRQASITVTSTGFYKLYVNECNVGVALFYPLRHGGDDSPVATTFDVTPYLRRDTNVVALLYSPTHPSAMRRQVAVSFYGTDAGGRPFCRFSDGSWLCRRANSRLTADGGELVDGREHDPSWKAATIYNQALWLSAVPLRPGDRPGDRSGGATLTVRCHDFGAWASEDGAVLKATHITTFGPGDISNGPDYLQLPTAIIGFPRVTMRNARSGQTVGTGSLTYVCSGRMDEQAFPVFSLGTLRAIHIDGGGGFSASCITGVEMVATAERPSSSFTEKQAH